MSSVGLPASVETREHKRVLKPIPNRYVTCKHDEFLAVRQNRLPPTRPSARSKPAVLCANYDAPRPTRRAACASEAARHDTSQQQQPQCMASTNTCSHHRFARSSYRGRRAGSPSSIHGCLGRASSTLSRDCAGANESRPPAPGARVCAGGQCVHRRAMETMLRAGGLCHRRPSAHGAIHAGRSELCSVRSRQVHRVHRLV